MNYIKYLLRKLYLYQRKGNFFYQPRWCRVPYFKPSLIELPQDPYGFLGPISFYKALNEQNRWKALAKFKVLHPNKSARERQWYERHLNQN